MSEGSVPMDEAGNKEAEEVNMSKMQEEVVNLEREVEFLRLQKRKEILLQQKQELEQVTRSSE